MAVTGNLKADSDSSRRTETASRGNLANGGSRAGDAAQFKFQVRVSPCGQSLCREVRVVRHRALQLGFVTCLASARDGWFDAFQVACVDASLTASQSESL
jgi:hypothetical protein